MLWGKRYFVPKIIVVFKTNKNVLGINLLIVFYTK